MFERFTDEASRVVVLAQEEARLLSHNYIGTEHLLLGLIHQGEGVAAKALESLGISLEVARAQVEEIKGQGQQAPSGRVPFTPRAKKVLELSLREALQLGNSYIDTEHILLGLVREGEGVAAQVLVKLGADFNRVRQQVIRLLSDREGSADPHQPQPAARASSQAMRRYQVEVQFELFGEGDQLEAAVRRTHEALRGQTEASAADLNLALRLLVAEAVIMGVGQRFPLQAEAKVGTVTVTEASGHDPGP